MKFYLRTFGCKANRYDSESIAQSLVREGHLQVSDPYAADINVVNTCAVTDRAETKAVRYIRKVGKEAEERAIVVIGCAVERDPEKFLNLPGVDLSLGSKEKYDLPRLIAESGTHEHPSVLRGGVTREGMPVDLEGVHDFRGRRRAFLKVQDGCSYRCSYCIIPAVRGRSVSRSPGAIVEEALSLVETGFREIVLTGIHIGLYGKDLSPRITLEKLLEDLLEKTSGVRFRLSSIDAHEIRDELIELIAASNRLCDHLHIPLQSGSPRILKSMRRRNSMEEFREACDKAISAVPCIGLGTDVITGFPGESEGDFELTCRVIEEIPFSYVHVFPFSPRPGTPASEMGSEMVREGVVAQRAMYLRQIALEGGRLFRKRQVGQKEEILVERKMGTWYMGRCSNYLKAFIDSDYVSVGDLKVVVVEDIWRDGIRVSTR